MKYLVGVSDTNVHVLVDADTMFAAFGAFAKLLGFKDYQHFWAKQYELASSLDGEKLNMIYATVFDKNTKQPLGASTPLHVETLAEAEKLIPGAPVVRTKNTLIYEQIGDSRLCLSWIRFSL